MACDSITFFFFFLLCWLWIKAVLWGWGREWCLLGSWGVGKILWACSLPRTRFIVFVNSPPFSPLWSRERWNQWSNWYRMGRRGDAHRDRTNLLLQLIVCSSVHGLLTGEWSVGPEQFRVSSGPSCCGLHLALWLSPTLPPWAYHAAVVSALLLFL